MQLQYAQGNAHKVNTVPPLHTPEKGASLCVYFKLEEMCSFLGCFDCRESSHGGVTWSGSAQKQHSCLRATGEVRLPQKMPLKGKLE